MSRESSGRGGLGGLHTLHTPPLVVVCARGMPRMCSVAQLSLTLCDPMECNMPGSSVHEILQARVLEWVATPFSRRSSQPEIEPASLVSFATRETPGAVGHPAFAPGSLEVAVGLLVFLYLAHNVSQLHMCVIIFINSLIISHYLVA